MATEVSGTTAPAPGDAQTSGSVIVVGSANADLVVRSPRIPRPGETVLGSGFTTHRGGKGANQAVAAARAGANVVMIARLGSDAHGTYLRDGLRADGIDDRFVGNCKHDPSGVALITVDDAGENSIVVVPGANALLRDVHVGDAADAGVFADAAVVLAQLEVPGAAVRRAFEHGRAAGARTVLNAAPADAVPADVLALSDVLIVNEHELRRIIGTDDLDAALDEARGRFDVVVLTLGGGGARLVTASLDLAAAAHRVDVVDTTGAGDAFCGAFAASLARGTDLADSLARANAAGALACTVAGAQPSAPTAAAIDELLASVTT